MSEKVFGIQEQLSTYCEKMTQYSKKSTDLKKNFFWLLTITITSREVKF